MSVLGVGTVALTAALVAALAANALLRRVSASRRHAVLAAALFVGAAAPAFGPLVPAWEIAVAPVAPAPAPDPDPTAPIPMPPDRQVAVAAVPAPAPVPWARALLIVWLGGALVTLAGLATGVVRLRRLATRCAPLASGPWCETADRLAHQFRLRRPVVLLQSPEPALLLTWGLWHPRVVLPAGTEAWSAERREVVLAHEFAHIQRHDWLLQMAAEVVRATYWFHPLVWIACRRLRRECEQACDDAVLNAGVEATTYASHLLDVARHAIGRAGIRASAPAIAEPSTLERRIAAMLHQAHRRDPLTPRAVLLSLACALVVTLPVAAVRVTPRAEAPVPPEPTADVMRVDPRIPANTETLLPRARAIDGAAPTAEAATQDPDAPPPTPRSAPTVIAGRSARVAVTDVTQGSPSAPPAARRAAQAAAPLPRGAIAVTPCSGAPLYPPAALPPAGSPPFIWMIDLCFARQGQVTAVAPETYVSHMQLRPSRPSQGQFVQWDAAAEGRALADRRTLVEVTDLLEDMIIEADEHVFPNGAIGVIVTYDMKERERADVVQ